MRMVSLDLRDVGVVYVLRPTARGTDRFGMSGVTVEQCIQRDDSELWAVRNGSNCLDKDGDFVHEPIPSSRDEEFTRMHRWDSFDAAMDAAREAIKAI